ncbi:MAG: hypothetical protein ACTHY7_12905 [Marinobacter sp.]|uniref:hypothetical protein n=1 Tax=Marinobacter sp. TaxID=50741 RepID=UPI003F983DE9
MVDKFAGGLRLWAGLLSLFTVSLAVNADDGMDLYDYVLEAQRTQAELQARIDNADDEVRARLDALRQAREELRRLTAYNAELAPQVEGQAKTLERRLAALDSLESMLANADLGRAEKLERVLAAWRSELDYGLEFDSWRAAFTSICRNCDRASQGCRPLFTTRSEQKEESKAIIPHKDESLIHVVLPLTSIKVTNFINTNRWFLGTSAAHFSESYQHYFSESRAQASFMRPTGLICYQLFYASTTPMPNY